MDNWRYIEETNVSASRGLAADEYLTEIHTNGEGNKEPAILKLYNFRDYTVLAGRFQDINAEINIEKCEQNGFGYGRRLTGGGAILMGSDQLGVCFTSCSREFKWEHIRELYTQLSLPIINALRKFGIEASFRSKNDLEVGGKKIAGLGVYINPKGGIQFHSSLLLDLDLDIMLQVLRIPIQKFSDKRKIATIQQRITTIKNELGQPLSMDEVKKEVKNQYEILFNREFLSKGFSLEENMEIDLNFKPKYEDKDWIFQLSPQDDMTGMSLKKTPVGLLRTYIGLKGDNIKSVLITGDFLNEADMFSEIESHLKWSPLDKNKISDVVRNVTSRYVKNGFQGPRLADKEIVDAIWLASQRAVAQKRYTYNGSCYYPN